MSCWFVQSRTYEHIIIHLTTLSPVMLIYIKHNWVFFFKILSTYVRWYTSMRFRTEDGLDFWCVPLGTYRFNLTAESKGIYTIIIDLDGDLFVVGTTTNKQQCKNKVRHFVGKYKIPVKVLLTEYLSDKENKFIDQYEYTYESYLQSVAEKDEPFNDNHKPKRLILKKEPFV